MLNKNVADYTNFQTLHTNKRITQAPGGNSSINLMWFNNKINHHQQLYNNQNKYEQYQQLNNNWKNYHGSHSISSYRNQQINSSNPNIIQYKNSIHSQSYLTNNHKFNNQYDTINKHGNYSSYIKNLPIKDTNKIYNQKSTNEHLNNKNHKSRNTTYQPPSPTNLTLPSNYISNNKPQQHLIINKNPKNRSLTIDYLPLPKNKYQKFTYPHSYNNKNLQQIDIAIAQQYHTNKKIPSYLQMQCQQQNYYTPQPKINISQKPSVVLKQIYQQNNSYMNNQNNKYQYQYQSADKKNTSIHQNNHFYYHQQYPPRTSVKVHCPPGGKQTLKLY